MGMPLCRISTTASTADLTSENDDTPEAVCNSDIQIETKTSCLDT